MNLPAKSDLMKWILTVILNAYNCWICLSSVMTKFWHIVTLCDKKWWHIAIKNNWKTLVRNTANATIYGPMRQVRQMRQLVIIRFPASNKTVSTPATPTKMRLIIWMPISYMHWLASFFFGIMRFHYISMVHFKDQSIIDFPPINKFWFQPTYQSFFQRTFPFSISNQPHNHQ